MSPPSQFHITRILALYTWSPIILVEKTMFQMGKMYLLRSHISMGGHVTAENSLQLTALLALLHHAGHHHGIELLVLKHAHDLLHPFA